MHAFFFRCYLSNDSFDKSNYLFYTYVTTIFSLRIKGNKCAFVILYQYILYSKGHKFHAINVK